MSGGLAQIVGDVARFQAMTQMLTVKTRQELQEAERNLTEIQQDVQEESKRLRSLSELTPDAAREVSAAIQRSRRSSLRQQIIISAVFFVLGSATTLGITLLVL